MQNTPEIKRLRSFGLIVGGVFALIGLWPAVFRGQAPRVWVLILAALLMILALVLPRSLRRVYQLWMAVGQALGWINTRLILGVIFYSLFTPIGLAMRMLGKDPMRRNFEPEANSYRVLRQPRPRSHLTHQF